MSNRSSILPITPARGYLLLKPLEQESIRGVDVSGVDEIPQRGKVLAVGFDTWYEGLHEKFESPAKKGDTVIHSSHGFENIRYEGTEYRLCPFSRILATISK